MLNVTKLFCQEKPPFLKITGCKDGTAIVLAKQVHLKKAIFLRFSLRIQLALSYPCSEAQNASKANQLRPWHWSCLAWRYDNETKITGCSSL